MNDVDTMASDIASFLLLTVLLQSKLEEPVVSRVLLVARSNAPLETKFSVQLSKQSDLSIGVAYHFGFEVMLGRSYD